MSRTRIYQNLKFDFFEVTKYFSLYSEITFSDIDNLFLERITYIIIYKIICQVLTLNGTLFVKCKLIMTMRVTHKVKMSAPVSIRLRG